ncbi:R3H and coiled-coil domain-containing protein 1 [Onychostruthus taczanowskii]|uniref:R3H and coiled-coil domain-containing protein 1 n=1 Tax=Onychostruthus taczanowskii TaxID=356909 RepID=UPI001B7FFC20|nr:R3H and coiled-coil domain-containing protein 1 [Onychostruthus taczanowskii]XP_041280770.1 R3H and coiled-coil domain-containing protein 1 [Onychostruthus taczanowskii]
MDGVFLSPSEDEFVGRIAEELEHFMVQGQHQRVLLFPPLSSRLRYLIHRTVENMELLSSFSVGEGWRRRTVICHSAVRLPNETSNDQKAGTNPARPQRPAQPWGRGGRGSRPRHAGDTHGDSPRASVGSGRITRPPRKKPDKALYVPKGIRKKANWRERESPGAEPDGDAAPGGENCPRNSIGDTQRELGEGGGSPGKEEQVPGKGSAEHPLCEEKVPSLGNSGDPCEQGSRDKDCSHSPSSALNKHPAEAGEEESSHASTTIPEGSEFQGQLQEENQSGRDSGGSECGRSSVPLENRGGSRTDPAMADRAVTDPPVLETQTPEGSRSQSPPGEQDSRNSEGGRAVSTRESPSAGQVEQQAPQKVLEGPREALAAPEALHGGDPGAPGRIRGGKEEEEDEERSDVAEALCRGLDLAAGDREGTRQSGLEDDCTAELLAEIVGNLTVKDISVERISVDYPGHGEAQLSEGDLGHVTEIYDFPSSLKTEDLMGMFSDFHESGFKIQWVDDTHALGIFSSLSTASQALGRRYPCLKIRPLIHASRQAKVKALQRPKLLQLGKERPQTDTAVARRLVSHALGWRHRQHEATGTEVFQAESLDQEE